MSTNNRVGGRSYIKFSRKKKKKKLERERDLETRLSMKVLGVQDLRVLKRGNMLPRKGHPISPGGRWQAVSPNLPT